MHTSEMYVSWFDYCPEGKIPLHHQHCLSTRLLSAFQAVLFEETTCVKIKVMQLTGSSFFAQIKVLCLQSSVLKFSAVCRMLKALCD